MELHLSLYSLSMAEQEVMQWGMAEQDLSQWDDMAEPLLISLYKTSPDSLQPLMSTGHR